MGCGKLPFSCVRATRVVPCTQPGVYRPARHSLSLCTEATMKTLYLIRHAHAEPEGPQLADRDRPLSLRGQRDAAAMGLRLAAAGRVPERLLCSPALRTRQTAQALTEALGLAPGALVVDEGLYASSPEELLAAAGKTDADLDSVAVVGHNPECSELLARFAPGAPGMPPGAVAVLEFDLPTWNDLGRHPPKRVEQMQPGL